MTRYVHPCKPIQAQVEVTGWGEKGRGGGGGRRVDGGMVNLKKYFSLFY